MTGGKRIWKFLLRLFGTLVSVVLLALITVSLILANPQGERAETPVVTPSPNASSAIQAGSRNELPGLISAFPAPVMGFTEGSGMIFVSGTSADTAYDGGFGRIATLYWQTPEGEPVTLQTIWPANALCLLESGYHFVPRDGPFLFGSASVRTENDPSVRIHATTEQGLYVALFPRSLSGQVDTLCRSLQLFTADSED